MSIDDRELGRRLKKIRQRKGLEQSDIADITGLSQSYVSRIEKGNGRLRDEYIGIISDKLNIDKEYFFKEYTHTVNEIEPITNTPKTIITPIMTDQAILTEFFDALKRKDEQINKLIQIQGRLFDKLEENKTLGEV